MPNTISANRSVSISTTRPGEHRRWQESGGEASATAAPVWCSHPVTGKQALFVNEGFTTRIVEVVRRERSAAELPVCSCH
ncbi:hypothetical protein J4733_21870 [Klebsiella pneumoniae]|uniref:Uncharacterized protein n=1 Tax=Klebsiella pneumoniae TaxID=573 RepID=A0A939NRC5_KLEPN|nr:hypothetical protein [Klebsiella pneumoniae]